MADRNGRPVSYGESRFSNSDDPPNSRLFIVCSKALNEDDFRNAFSQFGEIEEIWIVKDKYTREPKGVTYIKYRKTSSAANAMEALNGKTIGDTSRSIKVLIAASRDQGAKRDGNEEDAIQRLFVFIPKSMTEEELYNTFKVYGDIDYAKVIKDKVTRESKGCAYIKYFKFSHAAAAYEQCEQKFRAKFAEPRKVNPEPTGRSSNSFESYSKNNSITIPDLTHNDDLFTRLLVNGCPSLNQDQIWKLFDIIPGMDYCQLRQEGHNGSMRSVAIVVYANPQAAAYACSKLHGFEYPPGNRLIVKPDYDNLRGFNDKSGPSIHNLPQLETTKSELRKLAETIAHATSLIQAGGRFSTDLLGLPGLPFVDKKDDISCSVELPDLKPMCNSDVKFAARCFIICSQPPLSSSVLQNIFCRFGDLISVFLLSNRNIGYASYASKEAAENAIATLHGAEVCGNRIKVVEAEERDGNKRKRLRLDDESN